jgi:hypothetical protein
MASFRGRLAGPKMTSPGAKLTAQVCHPTKKSKESSGTNNLFLYKHWTKDRKFQTNYCSLIDQLPVKTS